MFRLAWLLILDPSGATEGDSHRHAQTQIRARTYTQNTGNRLCVRAGLTKTDRCSIPYVDLVKRSILLWSHYNIQVAGLSVVGCKATFHTP